MFLRAQNHYSSYPLDTRESEILVQILAQKLSQAPYRPLRGSIKMSKNVIFEFCSYDKHKLRDAVSQTNLFFSS